MNRLFIFIVILFSGCLSPAYIGESEKEYCSKNGIKKEKLVFLGISQNDSEFGYGKYADEIYSNYIAKKHDTAVYIISSKNKHIQHILYTFKSGICIKIDTVLSREEYRYL